MIGRELRKIGGNWDRPESIMFMMLLILLSNTVTLIFLYFVPIVISCVLIYVLSQLQWYM